MLPIFQSSVELKNLHSLKECCYIPDHESGTKTVVVRGVSVLSFPPHFSAFVGGEVSIDNSVAL
jgi:hypothetical protein